MMKSEKSKIFSGLSIRDQMMSGQVPVILENLTSDNSLGNVLAIGALVKNKIRTPETDNALKQLKGKDVFEFCTNVSHLAYAALDVLAIEKYTGNDKMIHDIIESQFNFVD